MKNVLVSFAILVLCVVMILMCRKYPMESGFYLFSKEGRAQHATQEARMKSAMEGNDYLFGGGEREKRFQKREKEYQQFKKRKDSQRQYLRKQADFHERYERENENKPE